MSTMDFARGMSIGIVVGAGVGMLMAPKKKKAKTVAEKAVRAVSEAAQNIAEGLGL